MTLKPVFPLLNALLIAATMTLAGCDKVSDDPKLRTFHPHSAEWKQEVEASYSQLSTEERQLLDRYIQRVNSGEAVQKGASETISITDAIMHQQNFERTQQNTDTQLNSSSTSEAYPLTMTVLPIQLNENREFKKVPLRIELTNDGNETLTSFKGTISLNATTIDTPQSVVIPLTRFESPLAQGDTTVIKVDTSFTNDKVIKALQSPQDISLTINKGTLMVESGNPIIFGAATAQTN